MLDRRVALKFLTAGLDDGAAVEQLMSEARAAAALDHPFICKIYEVAELEGRPCIVMEYVAGETLERRLRRGPVPVAETLRFAEEVAEALEAAHKRRLVHRDLKPANVMLTDGDHVKVTDFGLATRLPLRLERQTGSEPGHTDGSTRMLEGTPAYMSPEQATGQPVDRRSDIFSFGVLLYELVSGIQPFRRMSVGATLTAIREDRPTDLRQHLPAAEAALGAVVARMMEKDPAERYQSFGDVRLELRRLSGEIASRTKTDSRSFVEPSGTGDRGTLVGREPEQAELLRTIQAAARGRGGLVVVGGEAGVGKSRLVEDALADARQLGCLALVGRCYEHAGTPPLVPWIEALEEAARLLPASVFRDVVGRTAPELARLVPEVHRLFPDVPPPLELPSELQQRFLFNNIQEFLTRCSRVVPLAIFLDDLQWADESTLRLIHHLAPHVVKMAMVVVGAYRDVDVAAAAERSGVSRGLDHLLERVRGQKRAARNRAAPLAQTTLDQLVEQRLARSVRLAPLSEGGVGSLLAILGRKEPPAPITRRIFDETGGNPFFVEELFRHLKEEGRLFDPQGGWRRDLDDDEISVPAGVRTVIDRRVRRVDQRTHDVLTAAAVVGPHSLAGCPGKRSESLRHDGRPGPINRILGPLCVKAGLVACCFEFGDTVLQLGIREIGNAILDGVVEPPEFGIRLGRPLAQVGNVRPSALGAILAAIEHVRQKSLKAARLQQTLLDVLRHQIVELLHRDSATRTAGRALAGFGAARVIAVTAALASAQRHCSTAAGAEADAGE